MGWGSGWCGLWGPRSSPLKQPKMGVYKKKETQKSRKDRHTKKWGNQNIQYRGTTYRAYRIISQFFLAIYYMKRYIKDTLIIALWVIAGYLLYEWGYHTFGPTQ